MPNFSLNAVRYRTVFRIAKSDSRVSKRVLPRRFKVVWSQPMITFTILGTFAVGALLAATAYRVCRNEIVRKTKPRTPGVNQR